MEAGKQGWVYILSLAGGHFYVGFSQDLHVRIASHFLGAGSRFTQLHKPLSVLSVQPGDTMLETCVTISLMATHGWEKVRGGSYCTVEMTKPPACIAKALRYSTYKTGTPQVEPLDALMNTAA